MYSRLDRSVYKKGFRIFADILPWDSNFTNKAGKWYFFKTLLTFLLKEVGIVYAAEIYNQGVLGQSNVA